MTESDHPYYRILSRKGELIVACMQWFDEFDYTQGEYLFADVRFKSEEQAQAIIEGIRRWSPECQAAVLAKQRSEGVEPEGTVALTLRELSLLVHLLNADIIEADKDGIRSSHPSSRFAAALLHKLTTSREAFR